MGTKEQAVLFLYVAYNLLQYAEMQILSMQNFLEYNRKHTGNTIANERDSFKQL